jgi:hypothetical protein
MRKWLTVVLMVLLILCFLPAVFGLVAKKSLDHLLEDLVLPAGVSLSLEKYTFGWLKSYVAIGVHYASTDSLEMIIHGNIAHGPFFSTQHGLGLGFARLDTHATLDDVTGLSEHKREELYALFGDNNLLHASSVFKLNRDISIDLQSTPLQVNDAGDVLQWQGFKAHIDVNGGFNQIHTDAFISPMLFTTATGATLDSAQAHFIAKLSREPGSPWVGEQLLTLPTFYLKDETGEVLRFDHLRVVSTSGLIEKLLQTSLVIEANNVEVANQLIEEARFHLTLNNLASEPLLALGKLINQSKNLTARDQQEILKLATQALAPGADIDLDYRLTMKDEQLILDMLLDFPDISDTAGGSVVADAHALLANLNAQVELIIPQALATDAIFTLSLDSNLETLLQNNILVVQEGAYRLLLNYSQGKFILNDQVLTQDQLLMLLMILLQASPDASITH